jgi:hypothetical protein
MKTVTLAALALALGLGAVGATPAAASDRLVIQFGAGGTHVTGTIGGHPGWRPVAQHRPPHQHWRPAPRPVTICQPAWRNKVVHDRYGRVVKVVKTKVEQCRTVYR